MPIYEYRCRDCHQIFEEWCRHIEEENVAHSCPICSGEAKRLVSNTSFALKGGGWYVTEYGSRRGAPEKSGPAAAEGAPAKSKDSACRPRAEGAVAPAAPAPAH